MIYQRFLFQRKNVELLCDFRSTTDFYLTHEVVELSTNALLLLVFTLLDVLLPFSQISFTALLEEVDVSVCLEPSDDVFSLLDELFPIFCTIFIWLIEATEVLLVLLSLLLRSVEVLDTAENVRLGKLCQLGTVGLDLNHPLRRSKASISDTGKRVQCGY